MIELDWTFHRHRILTDIALQNYRFDKNHLIVREDGKIIKSYEKRALFDVDDFIMYCADGPLLTPKGKATLTKWNKSYGKMKGR